MRILFVTPYLPSPARFGAQRRIDGLMRGLSERHEISTLSFATPGLDVTGLDLGTAVAATRTYCERVITVPYDVLNVDTGKKRILQLASLASRRSFENLLMYRPEFQAALDDLLSREHFDVVEVEFSQMGIYRFARRVTGSPLFVLDEHNIEYDLIRRTAEAPGDRARRIYSALNWRKLKREELDAWRRFDGITLTSSRDRDLVHQELPSARTRVIPNAVDVEAFRPNGTPRDPATLLFLGAINYFPNTDGILHFMDAIFPRILASRPDVKLQIVGMGPPESVLSRKAANVEITGYVEDPLPYLDRATLVIVPLRIGGGTRFKVVEAMAKGKTIISTRLGSEGIDLEHERDVLFADTPDDFAAQVLRALADKELADRLGRAARSLAEERYSWRAAVGEMEEFYGEIASAPAFVRPEPALAS
jgi:glycosyltransferase involved in cell wall biosynthesis